MDIFDQQYEILNVMKMTVNSLKESAYTSMTASQLEASIIKLEGLIAKSRRAFFIAEMHVTETKDTVM